MSDKPSTKKQSSTQSTTDSADLEEALFAAFEPYLIRTAPLRKILLAAFDVASVAPRDHSQDSSSEAPNEGRRTEVIVISKAALMHGLVKTGLDHPTAMSSAAWLCEWLAGEGIAPETLLLASNAEPNAVAFKSGVPIIASQMLRERALPAARALAERTVGRDRAATRQLLFALLDEPPDSLGPIVSAIGGWKRGDLKNHLVERIIAKPENNENVDAWRELATAPKPGETVGTLSDAPALVDALGRHAFAEVLATRVKQVSKTLRSGKLGNDSAFILHIDGPWGSGKTSILNFLKENLETSDPPWVIVEFNAWRNQQRSPAWWPIISHVWGTVRRESPFKFKMARWVWLRWNMRIRWLPVALSIVLTGVLLYFAWQAVSGQTTGVVGAVKDIGAAVLALVTLAGLALTTSRSVFFGSKNAAETYVQSTVEPYRPIVRLFERLIDAIEQPVAVFIDDIDRCDSGYVIELLEGIQTLLRSAPVVYIVAGDRKWICSSFEKRYSDFGGQIGMPGRPLGYLFLDKVFQLSTAIPRLSTVRQAAYWKRLLESGAEGAAKAGTDVRKLEAEAEKGLEGKSSHEEIQQQIDETEEGSLEREAVRAAAAKQTTSREAIRAAEHRLQPLAHLLEPNPRSMKRLVNAYGLNQARVFLEGRKVEVEALARWTIVELRWPILADFLATNWTDIAAGSLQFAQFPELIRTLLADLDVKEVFGVAGAGGNQGQLTIESLAPILE